MNLERWQHAVRWSCLWLGLLMAVGTSGYSQSSSPKTTVVVESSGVVVTSSGKPTGQPLALRAAPFVKGEYSDRTWRRGMNNSFVNRAASAHVEGKRGPTMRTDDVQWVAI